MKRITTLCAAFSIVLGLITLNYTAPLITKGTAVIYSMTEDGKNGNKPLTTVVPDDLTNRQQNLLNFAYEIARADGYKHPSFLQGILMQESRGCSVKNFRVAGLTNKSGDRYFGCGQLKLSAAKAVLRQYPELWKYLDSRTDEELQARLILDDQFNIRISSKYCLMMGINENPSRAITAYNVGPGGVKNVNYETFGYTNSVKSYSEKISRHHKRSKNIQAKTDDLQSKSKYPVLLARDP